MRIALASDHAGYPLKGEVAKHLGEAGHEGGRHVLRLAQISKIETGECVRGGDGRKG